MLKQCSPRPPRLALCCLEDRLAPAAAVYAPETQTLTLQGATGDQLSVSAPSNNFTGFVRVTNLATGETVFDSTAGSLLVRHMVVHFGGADTGDLTIQSDVYLGGNLTVIGARTSQTFINTATVGGNLAYRGTGAAQDTVVVDGPVGGKVNLRVGGGPNTVKMQGGTVGQSLTIIGGGGADTVELARTRDLTVGGSVRLDLGGGPNFVYGLGANRLVTVGGSFSYIGRDGTDSINLLFNGTDMWVGGKVSLALGGSPVGTNNFISLDRLTTGGNLAVTAGPGNDEVYLYGELHLGGQFRANLGTGTNHLRIIPLAGGASTVGKGLSYAGGSGSDSLTLRQITVGGNADIALGKGPNQSVEVGQNISDRVTVFGTLRVAGGDEDDRVSIKSLWAGGLSLHTGAGQDTVIINYTDVAGATHVNLGAGFDSLYVQHTSNEAINQSTFGGAFVVRAGKGDDFVSLSNDGNAASSARFGGRVKLLGGDGNDVLRNLGNDFRVTGNFEDFEGGEGVP